jgi:hypothetical protein
MLTFLSPRTTSFVATIFSVLMLGVTSPALSFPVLDEVAGLPHPELVTVYKDDTDPNLFYFVPSSVTLVYENGKPRLGVQYWGLTGPDPDGAGAALTFSVKPAFDEQRVKDVANKLKEVNPNARFAFPTLIDSSMELILNGQFHNQNQDNFVPSVRAGTVDATQVFTVGLSRIGARAFAQGVAPDSDVLGARYTFKFTGVAKRLLAEITVFNKRVYDHFKAQATTKGWWGLHRTSWQGDWQNLQSEGSIKVRILQGGETDTDAYMLEVFKTLVNARINEQGMFAPKLKPSELALPAESTNFGWGFSSSAAWEHLEEVTNFKFTIDKRKLEDREFSVGLSFNAVCAKYPDSFTDLTQLGNKCLDKNAFAVTARETQECIKSELQFLKDLFDSGLIDQASYEKRLEKVWDKPCYKDVTPANERPAVMKSLEPLIVAVKRGLIERRDAELIIVRWLDKPAALFKKELHPSIRDFAERSISNAVPRR